eukprot:TRINITY_DN44691_c0_g1_i1.p1 TRINITY_DN44691_c0_g1~~TRINITY_DN44691_c0_g1_i1.p1  ORF type:complete len:794 (+),score=104.27 TRINITY_DN44691_c0_g1_i1:109-2382(+)
MSGSRMVGKLSHDGDPPETPVTLSDLGIGSRKNSINVLSSDGASRFPGWGITSGLPELSHSSARIGASVLISQESERSVTFPSASEMGTKAATVMITGGRAFYRAPTNTSSASAKWTERPTKTGDDHSPIGSRRGAMFGDEFESNSAFRVEGTDEDGCLVTFLDMTRCGALSCRGDSCSVATSRRGSAALHAGGVLAADSRLGSSQDNRLGILNGRVSIIRSEGLASGLPGEATDSRQGNADTALEMSSRHRGSLQVETLFSSSSRKRDSQALEDDGSLRSNSLRVSIRSTRSSMAVNIMPTVLDRGENEEADEDSSDERANGSSSSAGGPTAKVSSKSAWSETDRLITEVVDEDEAFGHESPAKVESRGYVSVNEEVDPVNGEGIANHQGAEGSRHRDTSEFSGAGDGVDLVSMIGNSPSNSMSTFSTFSIDTNGNSSQFPTDAALNRMNTRGSVVREPEDDTSLFVSLSHLPFTRDINVQSFSVGVSKQHGDNQASAEMALHKTSHHKPVEASQLIRERQERRRTTILSTSVEPGQRGASKTWRSLPMLDPVSFAHRTGRKYPNTPLSIAWFSEGDECFLFVGLLQHPNLLKILPPKHQEPDRHGRFNVFPIDSRRMLLADDRCHQIWLMNPQTKTMRHLAGCGKRGYLDGPLEICRMDSPSSMTLDPRSHYIYVADRGNHVIRKIDLLSGLMSTVVGNGTRGSMDGANAKRQALDSPFEVSFAEPHHLIISCADNAIRNFNLQSGVLETLLVGS